MEADLDMVEKLLLGDGGGEQDAAEVAAHQFSGHSYHLLQGCQKKYLTLTFLILTAKHNLKTGVPNFTFLCFL